jgi:ferritin-like metal-binding protein YciE
MEKMRTLEDLLVEQIKDLYYVEKQMLKNLPKLIKRATAPELKDALEMHLDETETHIEKLERVFSKLDMEPRGKFCAAIDGIMEEAAEIIEMDADPEVMDAAIIAAAQKTEHYEIATYGCVRTYARMLNYNNIAGILEDILEQEKAVDHKLTEIAETINAEAIEK